MPPIIGITTNHSSNSYVKRLSFGASLCPSDYAGSGVPVLIPSLIANDGWDTLYTRLNGFFHRRGDISLDYFPGDPQPLKNKAWWADFPHPRIPMWTRSGTPLN